MRKTHLGRQSSAARPRGVIVFSVGGQRMAARTEEVDSVVPYPQPIHVPSRTPFLTAVVRRDKQLLPVYDLAARMDVTVQGDMPLCLIARHADGPLAIRIDSDVPTLHMVENAAIQPLADRDPDLVGTVAYENERIPVFSLVQLGKHHSTDSGIRLAQG